MTLPIRNMHRRPLGGLVITAGRIARVAALTIARRRSIPEPAQVPARLGQDRVLVSSPAQVATVVVHFVSPLGFDIVETVEKRKGRDLRRAFLRHRQTSSASVHAEQHGELTRCRQILLENDQ